MVLWTDGEGPEPSLEGFLAAECIEYDKELAEWDIIGSIAHTQMLQEQGYLTAEELAELHAALLNLYESGISLEPGDEDIHTAVEEAVTGKTAAGKKMHTGRSRNDQVSVDERLYMKNNTVDTVLAALSLAEALSEKAETWEDAVMPGYTHMRQAVPTTVGTWLGSFVEALLDDIEHLKSTYQILDQSPLGAAAGYGTTLDIDRERTADLLGFSSVQENPVHSVNSRETFALKAVHSLTQLMLDVETLANDLLLFSTEEFGFVEIPEKFCTGSSVMPQKENPDVLELVNGKSAAVQGNQRTIQAICASSHSGYGRQSQAVKNPMMESFAVAQSTLDVISGLVSGLEINGEKIMGSMDESVHAAYTANQKVEGGTPFREAYQEVKENKEYEQPSPGEIPSTRVDAEQVGSAKECWEGEKRTFTDSVNSLLELAEENSASCD